MATADAARDALADVVAGNGRTSQGGLRGDGAQLVGGNVPKHTAKAADRSAGAVHDDDLLFAHPLIVECDQSIGPPKRLLGIIVRW